MVTNKLLKKSMAAETRIGLVKDFAKL